jgi:hypothetical protein
MYSLIMTDPAPRKAYDTFISIIFLAILITAVIIAWPYIMNVRKEVLQEDKPQLEGEVNVIVDENYYSQGTPIKITVTNNHKIPIYLAQKVECGASFFEIKNCMGVPIYYYRSCLWDSYQHQFTKLRPGDSIKGTWTQSERESKYDLKPVSPGCYKIIFPYSVEEKKATGEGWGDDRLEAESAKIYIE